MSFPAVNGTGSLVILDFAMKKPSMLPLITVCKYWFICFNFFQMGKQTMGTPCLALKHRSDNKLYRIQVRDLDPVYLMQVAFETA